MTSTIETVLFGKRRDFKTGLKIGVVSWFESFLKYITNKNLHILNEMDKNVTVDGIVFCIYL